MEDDWGMAYDEDLAHRIRELIGGEPEISEQRMFGGLAFLVGGKMSVAVSGNGGLIVRVDPEETERFSPRRTRNRSRCADGRCRDDCASAPRACEPNASSNPGSGAALRTHARFPPSGSTTAPPPRR